MSSGAGGGQPLKEQPQLFSLRGHRAAQLDLGAGLEAGPPAELVDQVQTGGDEQPVVEVGGVGAEQGPGLRRAGADEGLGELLRAEVEGLHVVHVEVAEGAQGVTEGIADRVLLVGGDRRVVRARRAHRAAHQLPRQLVEVGLAEGAPLAGEGEQPAQAHGPFPELRAGGPRRQQQPFHQRHHHGRRDPQPHRRARVHPGPHSARRRERNAPWQVRRWRGAGAGGRARGVRGCGRRGLRRSTPVG
ncbi:hypothetical protein RB200_01260 [Streptomyces sp. PmtG]